MRSSTLPISVLVLVPVLLTVCLIGVGQTEGATDARSADPNASGGVRVLAITDVPEVREINYVQRKGAFMFVHDYFLSPQRQLADEFDVTQLGWLHAGKSLDEPNRYDMVILWDMPGRAEDQRDYDPYYEDLELLTEARAAKLAEFVRQGGALVVAGGVTCYGDGHEKLGSADYRQDNKRNYFGWDGSALEEVLPVEIGEGATLTALDKPDPNVASPTDPMVMSLDFSQWGFRAFHSLTAKDGAEVLVTVADGRPLVARWRVGKGRVVCVTASPKGNLLPYPGHGPSVQPTWADEAVFWDRVVRWTLGRDLIDPTRDAASRRRYAKLLAKPENEPLAWRKQEYPYLTHQLTAALAAGMEDMWYAFLEDLNFNTLVLHGNPLKDPKVLDTYLSKRGMALRRNNLAGVLHMDLAVDVKNEPGVDPNDYAQQTRPHGAKVMWYGQPSPDPYCPAVKEHSVQAMDLITGVAKNHPDFLGAVVNDEWSWTLGYRNPYEGQQGLASFSPWTNAYYKAVTGKEPPEVIYREPGFVAPEEDEFLQWCTVIRRDAFAGYHKALKAAADKNHPGFKLTSYPGGFDGNLDFMTEEIYLDCWKESALETLERIDVRANLRNDRSRTAHPIYALIGIFRMPEDKSSYPETVRLQVGLSLGSGAKGIILWNVANLWSTFMQHPDRDPLWQEARRLGEYIEKFGPTIQNLEKVNSDVWCLSGWFWVNSFNAYMHIPPTGEDANPYKEFPWWDFQVSDVSTPALMRSGLYPEFVTEHQLLSDDLFDARAVFLPGLVYCRQAVVDNLAKFIRLGGTVYVDQSAKVVIPGATKLDVDLAAWHREIAAGNRPIAQPNEQNYRKHTAQRDAIVRDAIQALQPVVRSLEMPVTLSSTKAAHTWLKNGRTKYLFVYNADVNAPQTVDVTFRRAPSHVYDLSAGKRVLLTGTTDGGRTSLNLPAGGWKVLVVSDQGLRDIQADGRATDGELTLDVEVRGMLATFDGAVPLKITLRSPAGDRVIYRATDGGKLELTLPVPPEMPALTEVIVTEMLTGKSDRAL
jgi:uncharacterized membrane protein